MKTLVSVYAAAPREYAFEPLFDGKSAFDRVIDWIDALAAQPEQNLSRVVVFTSPCFRRRVEECVQKSSVPVQVVDGDFISVSSFLSALDSCREDCSTIIHCRYSCPFYDSALTAELVAFHHKYAAEYTFAEGWPEGLAPVVINGDTVSILKALSAETDFGRVGKDVFFDVIRSDINSFEVETLMAPEDMRQYRLDFSCHSREGQLSCQRIFQLLSPEKGSTGHEAFSANALAAKAVFSPGVLRTVPAFYNVQISAACPGTCTYCPYPRAYRDAFGHFPADAPKKNAACFMSLDKFRPLVAAMANLSGEAVVSLSLWGEALAHPDFLAFVEEVLKHPGLSVLVETDGSLVTAELSKEVRSLVEAAAPRTNGHEPMMWIVSLDSQNQAMYERMRGSGTQEWAISFDKAQDAFTILNGDFPGAAYAQFVRTETNEEQLESFYRGRKDGGGLIIQKYDDFLGFMPNLQVADLSPVLRNPCWHLRRDMVILVDGSVPVCRELLLSGDGGNVFRQSLEAVWERGRDIPFMEKCESCDEYYTFNF